MIPILRLCHVKLSFKGLLWFVMIGAGNMVPGISPAQSGEPVITQEYFVQQAVDEALLITINAFEAEFESKISGQDGESILQSGIPGSRIVPVFQYINVPKSARQLDIRVTSSLHTRRSEFGLELTRLKVWDDRSSKLSRAYQLLSFGMQLSGADSEANWTVKIENLLNAGRLFHRFGMVEMRLWSNYLAAHLILFHLHDHSMVYSMTREILAELKGLRFHKLELATLQLHAAAVTGLMGSGKLGASVSNPDPVQSILSRTAELAESMGYRFELARALNDSGIEYATGSLFTRALAQFQQAVAIADAVGDAELATGIRESIVQIHALQGNAPASSTVLQEIETRLVESGDGDELALNLLAQGRLFIRSYRYSQAHEVLLQALNYQNDSAIRKQVNFELAMIFYQTGRLDQSIRFLQRTGLSAGSNQSRRGSPVIDVGKGLRVLANIHRARGDFELMHQARRAQGQHRPLQSQYLYDQGLDALAPASKDRIKAQSLFRQSHKVAATSGHEDIRQLSLLQICAIGVNSDDTRVLCSISGITAAYEHLRSGGVPAYSVEAMFLRARIQIMNGRSSQAVAVMDQLVEEIHFLRYTLPGVLGAWYREQHERLFDTYLDLLVSNSGQRGRADASASLLGLSKIRLIEKFAGLGSVSKDEFGNTDLLRAQLAQRAHSRPGQSHTALNDSINQGLAKLRIPFRRKFAFLSKNGLQKYLRGLSSDELVLTFHISSASARVWVGKNGRVQQRNIANPAYLYGALQDAQQGLNNIGITAFENKMAALGKRLIAPIADLLTDTLYWIPAGPLLGFPLDALRVNGRYLAEHHTVINLVSFPQNTNPGTSLRVGTIKRVFLAGHPQDYSSVYATRLDTSAEIRAIADIFVGPGLRIVQGAALLVDEFRDGHFQQAGLVHLSMPGVIDLKFPDQSSLELSQNESDPRRGTFTGGDIRAQKLDARLVFLSATRTKGNPVSGFINQTGLISDFVDAGAHSVIANLWAADSSNADYFITDFYHKLEASGNIANALTGAKRQYLKNNRNTGLYDWAGYQVFIE